MVYTVLGIETSCDETAAAVVTSDRKILAHTVLSQTKEHAPYGGVVPEIASRAHIAHIESIIARTMQEAGLDFHHLDAVAATAGPGLIGGVIVGVMTAKAIASAASIPFIAVNHLEGHALTPRLIEDVAFPYLLLLVSGGHCEFLRVSQVGQYQKLGGTIDDAVGEAFDKVAKMLGLGYPGGPQIEALAKEGDIDRYALPLPLIRQEANCQMSFSGLKTAVKRIIDTWDKPFDPQNIRNLAASFQRTIGDILCNRLAHAIRQYLVAAEDSDDSDIRRFVLSGGVAANRYLRKRLIEVLEQHDFTLFAPPLSLCTDNGAMIAWAGVEHLQLGHQSSLAFAPRPRWPLSEL